MRGYSTLIKRIERLQPNPPHQIECICLWGDYQSEKEWRKYKRLEPITVEQYNEMSASAIASWGDSISV